MATRRLWSFCRLAPNMQGFLAIVNTPLLTRYHSVHYHLPWTTQVQRALLLMDQTRTLAVVLSAGTLRSSSFEECGAGAGRTRSTHGLWELAYSSLPGSLLVRRTRFSSSSGEPTRNPPCVSLYSCLGDCKSCAMAPDSPPPSPTCVLSPPMSRGRLRTAMRVSDETPRDRVEATPRMELAFLCPSTVSSKSQRRGSMQEIRCVKQELDVEPPLVLMGQLQRQHNWSATREAARARKSGPARRRRTPHSLEPLEKMRLQEQEDQARMRHDQSLIEMASRSEQRLRSELNELFLLVAEEEARGLEREAQLEQQKIFTDRVVGVIEANTEADAGSEVDQGTCARLEASSLRHPLHRPQVSSVRFPIVSRVTGRDDTSRCPPVLPNAAKNECDAVGNAAPRAIQSVNLTPSEGGTRPDVPVDRNGTSVHSQSLAIGAAQHRLLKPQPEKRSVPLAAVSTRRKATTRTIQAAAQLQTVSSKAAYLAGSSQRGWNGEAAQLKAFLHDCTQHIDAEFRRLARLGELDTPDGPSSTSDTTTAKYHASRPTDRASDSLGAQPGPAAGKGPCFQCGVCPCSLEHSKTNCASFFLCCRPCYARD
jgi:hypothetical protein